VGGWESKGGRKERLRKEGMARAWLRIGEVGEGEGGKEGGGGGGEGGKGGRWEGGGGEKPGEKERGDWG